MTKSFWISGVLLLMSGPSLMAGDSLESIQEDYRKKGRKATVDDAVDACSRCLALAEASSDEESAFETLSFGLQLVSRSAASDSRAEDMWTEIMDLFIDAHLDDAEKMVPIVERYLVGEASSDFGKKRAAYLEQVTESAEDNTVLAACHWGPINMTMRAQRRDPLSGEAREATIADLKAFLASSYKDAESPFGDTYGSRAESALFELERLSLGCIAPDIEGEDTDGVAFKLSDYRGKVVLLDFWGHW